MLRVISFALYLSNLFFVFYLTREQTFRFLRCSHLLSYIFGGVSKIILKQKQI